MFVDPQVDPGHGAPIIPLERKSGVPFVDSKREAPEPMRNTETATASTSHSTLSVSSSSTLSSSSGFEAGIEMIEKGLKMAHDSKTSLKLSSLSAELQGSLNHRLDYYANIMRDLVPRSGPQ